MVFGSSTQPIPERLTTDEFVFRPLRATDAELDFDAVVESRDDLHTLFRSPWPREGFTLAENRHDLEMHELEHAERTAFAFTIMTPDETRCLGCIYISPLSGSLEAIGADAQLQSDATDDDATICFWVRSSHLSEGLENRVLDRLIEWLRHAWSFRHAFLTMNDGAARQVALFRTAALHESFRVPGKPGHPPFLFFEVGTQESGMRDPGESSD